MGGADRDIEAKFVFAAADVDFVHAWLAHAMLPDPRHPANCVSSIYFESPDLRSYFEKRASEYHKAKLRLRWYSAPGDGPTEYVPGFLEVKRKFGSVRRKRRIEVRLPAAPLRRGPFEDDWISKWFAEHAEAVADLMPSPDGPLVPAMLIRYQRTRYMDPSSGARVAVDTGIACPAFSRDVFPAAAGVRVGPGVLEVKGISDPNRAALGPLCERLHRMAFSKYAVCCELLHDPLGVAC